MSHVLKDLLRGSALIVVGSVMSSTVTADWVMLTVGATVFISCGIPIDAERGLAENQSSLKLVVWAMSLQNSLRTAGHGTPV